MNEALTPERVAALKKEAAALKTAQGIKQTAALAQIAQREGFKSWEHLLTAAGGAANVKDAIRTAQPATTGQIRRAERRAKYVKDHTGAKQ